MMTSDDKVGGWVKKGQNHNDVILEWSLSNSSDVKSNLSPVRSAEIFCIAFQNNEDPSHL